MLWRECRWEEGEEIHMESCVNIKNTCDDFEVEFEVQPLIDAKNGSDERQRNIDAGLSEIDQRLSENQQVLDELNAGIEKLTNHADGLDYMIAVASGILAGAIDIIFVEDFSLEKANEWGTEKTNNFVVKMAQKKGYKGNDLAGAVSWLEDHYHIAADGATGAFGGGLQHHLRDFSHHPTPVGLIFSFLTQFTGKVYGTDTAGRFLIVDVKEKDFVLIGKNFPEKVTFGVINWFFHMVSDMAGSYGSVLKGKPGTGLPGPLVSFLKEISALPFFRKTNGQGYKEFSVWISKLFNGTLLGKRDENGKLIPLPFDLRTEIGVMHQLGQQAIPVIINECIVRGFYFIRRFYMEIKINDVQQVSDLKHISWENTLPFKNRTVIRMLTIATGTMTAIDLADAAIEAAIKSGGINPAFVPNMLVKVNFVGVGRFAVAVASDVKMGVDRAKLRNKRIAAMNERICLLNGKVFYKQAEVWIAAENTQKTIEDLYAMMEQSTAFFAESYRTIDSDLKKMNQSIPGIRQHNPGLLEDMKDILEWG